VTGGIILYYSLASRGLGGGEEEWKLDPVQERREGRERHSYYYLKEANLATKDFEMCTMRIGVAAVSFSSFVVCEHVTTE